MYVHPTITHKKGTRYSQNSPCSSYHLLRLALLQSSTLRFSLLPNLPFIFIIGIPGKPCQLHALHIVQCTTKSLTMDADFLFGRFRLLGFKSSAFLRPTCFPFNFAVTRPSRVRWCKSATSFSDCSKANLICSFANAIRYSLIPFKAIRRACKMIESYQNGKATTRMSAAPIQGQIEKIKKRKLNYAAMRADGELPREEYQALCKQADDEIAHLEQELKALSPCT